MSNFKLKQNGAQVQKAIDYALQVPQISEAIDNLGISGITQVVGDSESLVMSQKAVAEFVDEVVESIGEVNKAEFETVDSVEEMTDTSKMYILSLTNTLWAYGQQGEPQPNFTNLADPTSAEWWTDSRIGSDGTQRTGVSGNIVTNPITIKPNDTVRVDGLDLTITTNSAAGSSQCGVYLGTAIQSVALLNNQTQFFSDVTVSATGGKATSVASKTINVRFTGKPTNGADNVIVTINEEITYTVGYAWYDTGVSSGESENVGYVKLLVKTNNNAANIAEISRRLTNLETGSESLVIPTFWKNAVSACIAKIKALQVGKNCVTFPFFSDNHTRDGKAQYMGVMIAYIMQECGIPYCFCGGDVITSAYIDSEDTMIAQDAAFDTAMSYIPYGRFCRAVGNHDGYWAVSASEKHYYTRAQIYDLFLREEGVAQNKHFGDDGTYYYIDDIVSKVRWVVLNTNAEGGGENIDAVQLSWLQHTALSFNETGWGVVIISHHPISNHYHANVTNAAEVISVVNSAGVDIIGWYSGHIHRDRIYAGVSKNDTDDTVGDAMGFTQVTITSDHTGIAYDDATKHTVANDDQSHAIDFVTINKATRTVNLTRLGIGEDRSYTY